MKIEIEYNGTYAICKVDGKYIHECDSLTKAQAFNAFETIKTHIKREEENNKINKKNYDI